MSQQLWFFDLETYYDDEYSLRKLTPPEYILDARYEGIMLAAAEGTNPSFLVDGPDIPAFLHSLEPAKVTTVCFNALFDNSVFAWRYGFVPARMLCSMRMAVATRGHLLRRHSLAAVGECLGVGVKGTEIHDVKGLHRADIIQSGLWNGFTRYALNDNEMNRGVFLNCAPDFPSSERRVMDRVLRCAIEPRFRVDVPMLKQHLVDLEIEKQSLMSQAGVSDPSELRSNPKFQAMLEDRGVEIEYKTTATGNNAPAFAKTDEFMEKLQEHEDPIVQALACARLGIRSSIEQTRGARMLSIAALDWGVTAAVTGAATGDMLLPIPLSYSGAHTHRLSGDWKINMQNLPAGRGGKTNNLRKAIIPPPGHEMIVSDLEQIECRVNAWLCGQADLLATFAKGLDPYAILASLVFGYPIDKKVHLLERFVGKSGELGLGFQCGATKFYNMVIRSARVLGLDMAKLMAVWTPELAQRTVDTYRSTHGNIKWAWGALDYVLKTAWLGTAPPAPFGPVTIGEGYVLLPNGMKMNYQVSCRDPQEGLSYIYEGKTHPIYGGRFLENIVQALARIILFNAAMRIWDRGYPFKLSCHDELGWIVPTAAVQEARLVIAEEMTRPPSWARNLPLGAAVESGNNYGACK
jgi:DNA polymerase